MSREESKLKIYADRLSQPCRALIIFCKVSGIDFEEVTIDLLKGDHKTQKYKDVNPMGMVPAIVDERLTLFESHAILSYIACAYPGVPDHWYPADLVSRAKINSILDWHHSNLRQGAVNFTRSTVLAQVFGCAVNLEIAAKSENILSFSLSFIESVWLKGDAKFLLGNPHPSIADLSLVCEITQSEIWHAEDRDRILGPHPKILQWVQNVKIATDPYFEEVHNVLNILRAKLHTAVSTDPSKV